MSGLSVTLQAALVAAAIAFVACSSRAAVTVRSIDDLRADPEVAALEEKFQTLASAAPIFVRCVPDYSIAQEQQDTYKDLLSRTTKDYNEIYYTTYVKKVGGAPPPQKVVDYYQYYITNEQQAAIQTTNQYIDAHSCEFLTVRNIYQAVQKLEQDDQNAKKTTQKPADPWSH